MPLYQDILADLTDRIASGDLAPGEMLPAEAELGAAYGASQGTARRALGLLEARGLLERRQGRGTFVARSTDERALFHFFRLRRPDGTAVVPTLVRQDVRRRRALRSEGALEERDVYEIERLRAIEGRIAAHERIVLPASRFAGLDGSEPPNALYPFYQRRFGVTILDAEETLTPISAGANDPLDAGEGDLLLGIGRRARDVMGRVAELRQCRYAMRGLVYSADIR
ncbi:MAG: GntR family transcriptional regulator [Pseudomonadota bacterium]